ncbi:MAG: transcription-repair coupling factor [Bacteroidota bacterium]
MGLKELIQKINTLEQLSIFNNFCSNAENNKIFIDGVKGSFISFLINASFKNAQSNFVVILNDKEEAAYLLNDIESISNLLNEHNFALFFPKSLKKYYNSEESDNSDILMRAETLNAINLQKKNIIITYPEALIENVLTKKQLTSNTLSLNVGENVSLDFLLDVLIEYGFERVDYVYEPGQFSIRGGIIDVFSFSNEHPYRVEFFGNQVDSIRIFEATSQLSINKVPKFSIIPNVQNNEIFETKESFFNYLPTNTIIFIKDLIFAADRINSEFEKATSIYTDLNKTGVLKHKSPEELYLSKETFLKDIINFSVVEFGKKVLAKEEISFKTSPQSSFNKNFDLILNNFIENKNQGFENIVFSDNPKQFTRIEDIFNDINKETKNIDTIFCPIKTAIHEGFLLHDLKIAFFSDHQLFERHHRFRLKEGYARKEALTIKEIINLSPGDFVTHIDHGVGRFDGLEKIEVNGKSQEAIRLIYKDNDILYVSIHSLHRINKYTGKEGTAPSMHRLGSGVWNKLKDKTKSKVKEIAIDLIRLYAERKMKKGFAFAPDNYLQNELEASFIYEDTPDQIKSTIDVKKDMEAPNPMDRLICGDVGFGKTEIAIRAAFKAVCDSKQVAILVPTTILALQHYKTLSERLKDLPCNVDYINRFKSAKQQKETIEKLANGKVDIVIGTHRILSKDIKFKDLGLLVIDEEQKFGVAAKEKMREMKTNVDTLTLTATPIPRTLQFSLMGARDLSVINTPPPNRQPIKTEIIDFSEEIIRDAINYEIERGGQIFFIHNRVQNINEVKDHIHRICPKARITIGHGQMDGEKLEEVMLDFIEGDFDVLIATTIIESGLDITNANTIIINNAQNFGLSDLHQMRGRVGRSNKKAFCYLIAPPSSMLTDEANKRLKAIEDFSDLGSGFNIAMRDLDIRGAGNILGGEQSGFINEMGYDTYLKILQESVEELKETEFKELFEEENKKKDFVKECVFESDLAIHIPDEYVNESSERINLYRSIDNLSNEAELIQFEKDLNDRFGATPSQTVDLLNTIRLRWIAKELGFEKLVLKNSKLVAYLISNEDSDYYQSLHFSKIIEHIKYNYNTCSMLSQNGKATLTFKNIKSVSEALEMLINVKMIDVK